MQTPARTGERFADGNERVWILDNRTWCSLTPFGFASSLTVDFPDAGLKVTVSWAFHFLGGDTHVQLSGKQPYVYF